MPFNILWASPTGQNEFDDGLLQASRYSYSVLITGPQGAGKELIARAIHAHSPRAEQPFIPFRCGTLPESMTARQLFGHAAGAGSLTRHAALGCLGAAQGGTLLLHEVGDLDLDAQDRLLDFLHNSAAAAGRRRCNSVRPTFASSRRRLRIWARRHAPGRFRLRLLYSLNAITIQAQPLAERRADIAPLARHIAGAGHAGARSGLSRLDAGGAGAAGGLRLAGQCRRSWNVSIEQAIASSPESQVLDLEDFPDVFAAVQEQSKPRAAAEVLRWPSR